MATTAKIRCPIPARPEHEPLLRVNRHLDRALRRLRRRLRAALEQSAAAPTEA